MTKIKIMYIHEEVARRGMSYMAAPSVFATVKSHGLEDIIGEVARACSVPVDLLYEKCRRRRVVFARFMVWKIMRSMGYTYVECGAKFGMDHTSVTRMGEIIDFSIENEAWVGEAWRKVSRFKKENIMVYAKRKQRNPV